MATRDLFDDDHDAFRDTVRRFLAAEVVPHLDEWRTAGRVPSELFASAGANGLLGTAVPEEFGGGGVEDLLFSAVLVEETAAAGAIGLALTFAVHAGVCLPLLLEHGTGEQHQTWVPGLVSGEHIGAVVAVCRPVAAIGADHLLLETMVQGVSGAQYAGVLVTAVEVAGAHRLALISGDADAVSRTPVSGSLGARDAGQADLDLRGELSATALLGAGALSQARRDLDLWSAVLAVSAARSVLRITLDYVRDRKVFGRPLVEFENTRRILAEVAAGIEATQLFVDSCLRERGTGTLASARAATARLGAAAIHDRAVDQGMQLHGGYGYMREYPISHAFADARYLRVHDADCSDALDAVAVGLGI